ncbi:transmembrane protein 192-like [Arvicola amphibius]|uniref:transmembrane protein 192-like n=1 Tax=Arvicola amphibius TaxID=1047088 RepID=UPI001C08649A|nr:transmembrane protein 192-like [Arvicola amphibius]
MAHGWGCVSGDKVFEIGSLLVPSPGVLISNSGLLAWTVSALGRQRQAISNWRQPPIPAVSLPSSGNTALLLLLCMQHSFPEPSSLYLELILAVLALELICSLSCLLLYAVKIRRFNRSKPQPDVLEEERMYAHPSNIASETGFRTISSLEEIVEKQGDIIVYLKRHNALLSKRLLDLASQPSRT